MTRFSVVVYSLFLHPRGSSRSLIIGLNFLLLFIAPLLFFPLHPSFSILSPPLPPPLPIPFPASIPLFLHSFLSVPVSSSSSLPSLIIFLFSFSSFTSSSFSSTVTITYSLSFFPCPSSSSSPYDWSKEKKDGEMKANFCLRFNKN